MLRRLAAPCHHDKDSSGNDHRHRQQHTHGQPAPQKSELRIRLAEKLADDARKRVDRDEAAEDQARPLQRAHPDHDRQDRKQQDAPRARPRRAGSDAAAAARHWGTPSPRARSASAGRPHNSLLMKLASRPRNSPIGPTAVVMSPSDRIEMSFLRANSITAATQPRKPPWNDMPPFHNSKNLRPDAG